MSGVAIAIDIGGTATKIAAVGKDGVVQAPAVMATALDGRPVAFIERLTEHVRKSMAEAGEVIGVGVSIAGFIDAEHSCLTYNPNLAELERFPLARGLKQLLKLPVIIEVDSNAACLAEHRFGGGRGVSRLLVVAIGTGLGCGMTIDGRLVRFAGECMGDMGHIIVEPGGPLCSAGCRGCAESLVSAPALERRAGGGRSSQAIIEAAREGDSKCVAALRDAGRYLGIAMASWSAMFLPQMILVAGGLSEAGELLLSPAIESFEQTAGAMYRQGVTVARSEMGWQAALLGAAVPVLALGEPSLCFKN